MKLTFKEKKGFIPVAKVVDAKGMINNEILFLDPTIRADSDSESDSDIEMSMRQIDYNKYVGKLKPREALIKQNQLAKHITKKNKPLDDDMLQAYNKIKSDTQKEFKLQSGTFVPIPDVNKERVIYYIFAPSGAGKTYLTASILKQWMKLNAKKDIYIFSKLTDDKVIDDLGERIKRINIDTLKESPIDVSEIPEGSMVVFDDTDCLEDKVVNEAILKLENSIYQVGRHYKISCIKTSHLGSDYKRTRVVLSESHYIVVYPNAGSFQQVQYVLKTYMGLSNADIQQVKNLRSRWVVCARNYPQYVLYETGCYLLSK